MTAKGLLASAGLLAVMAALSAWGWLATPEGAEFAVHWNAAGQPDRFGGKAEAFLVMPGIGLLLTVIFAAAPHIDPRGRNLARSSTAFLVAWIGVMVVLTLTHLALVLAATGVIASEGQAMPKLILLAVSALLVVLGNVLGKARPNWFFGVRTPWSLSSDKAWDVSHRWAARAFVLAGIGGAAAVLLAPLEAAVVIFTTLALLAGLGPILISYLVWRRDLDRETFSEEG
jgi:uncharacterized membrane protein